MSDFNDDFPSLKIICPLEEKVECSGKVCDRCGSDHTLSYKLLKKLLADNCLDKQKVREVLDMMFCKTFSFNSIIKLEQVDDNVTVVLSREFKEALKKELGL